MDPIQSLRGQWVSTNYSTGPYLVRKVTPTPDDFDEMRRWTGNPAKHPGFQLYSLACLSLDGYLQGKREADSWLNNYALHEGEYKNFWITKDRLFVVPDPTVQTPKEKKVKQLKLF